MKNKTGFLLGLNITICGIYPIIVSYIVKNTGRKIFNVLISLTIFVIINLIFIILYSKINRKSNT